MTIPRQPFIIGKFMSNQSSAARSAAPPKGRVRQNVESFALAIFFALVVRSSVVEAFWVPSGSMLPTIQIGDHLFVNKLAYALHVPFTDYEVLRWGHPKRGDIIVFLSPPSNPGPNGERIDLIKRVIAVGGDTLEIRDKKILINGEQVADADAHFLDEAHRSIAKRDNLGPITVPSGKLFMMGDNRDFSHDSRFWGFADETDVKGQATFIYWSREAGSWTPRWDRFLHMIR